MKEASLKFLKALSQSEEGKKNPRAIKALGSELYRLFGDRQFANEVEAITTEKPQLIEQPVQGQMMNVWTPTRRGNAPAPQSPAVAKGGKTEPVKEVAAEMTLDTFGIGAETYADLITLDPEGFIKEIGGLENVKQVGRLLGIKSWQVMNNLKLVSEIQKALPDAFKNKD